MSSELLFFYHPLGRFEWKKEKELLLWLYMSRQPHDIKGPEKHFSCKKASKMLNSLWPHLVSWSPNPQSSMGFSISSWSPFYLIWRSCDGFFQFVMCDLHWVMYDIRNIVWTAIMLVFLVPHTFFHVRRWDLMTKVMRILWLSW